VTRYYRAVSGAPVERGWLGRVDRWGRSHDWTSDVLTAVGCAAVLGALSLSTADGITWSAGWSASLIASLVVLHASVAVRGHAPVLAYILASAAMLVIVLAPGGRVTDPVANGPSHLPALVLPSSLAYLFPLYTVAARVDAARGRIALAAALVGVAVATGSSASILHRYAAGGWLVDSYLALALAVGVLGTWSLGRSTHVRRARTARDRSEAARLAVLEERARIAREMHDIVAHSLAVIVRQAEGGAFVASRDADRAATALHTIADTGRDALADIRRLLGVLRDPDAMPPEPQPRLTDLAQLVDGVRRTGMDVRLAESGSPFAVGPAIELAGFRLVQEGLTNVVKHAGRHIRVAVAVQWTSDALIVEVSDDGVGRAADLPGIGAGLQGLRERVTAAGGTFDSAPLDPGFRVRARFPKVGLS
jgi:signal transduction histidine kinase